MDYHDLNDLIARLRECVEYTNPQKGYWRELWSLVRETSDGFRTARFPTRAEKDEAWERFQSLRVQADSRSEANRIRIEERQQVWQLRQQRSSEVRSQLAVKTWHTRPTTELERMIAAPILLPLQMVEGILRQILGLEQLDEIKENLLACSEHMREAWRLFSELKGELLPADKAETYKLLSDAQGRLDAAWARWKDESHRLFTLKQEAWQQRQLEREQKHRQFVERVEANIESLEGKIESAKSALERNESHLEKLREDHANAWNDNFRERCSEWIESCEEKIADIRSSIERMEMWLSEERSKLR